MLELKLEAYVSDFRGKLDLAYRHGGAAEEAFHSLVAREGLSSAVAIVQRDPRILGQLVIDPSAAETAVAAAARGAKAYELNGISNPAQAAEILQRETQLALARRCGNPLVALLAVNDAIRRFGADLVVDEIAARPTTFFVPVSPTERLNGPAIAADIRALEAARAAGQRYVESTVTLPLPGLPVGSRLEASIREYAEAEETSARKQGLHVAANEAGAKLRAVESAEKWKHIQSKQFDAELGDAFKDGPKARQAFDTMAKADGHAKALALLESRPAKFGRVKDRASVGSAVRYAKAMVEKATYLETVEWTDAGGVHHKGGAAVRTAAARQMGDAAAEVGQAERALRRSGGPGSAFERVISAMGALGDRIGPVVAQLVGARPELKDAAEKAHAELNGRQAGGATRGLPGISIIPQLAGHVRQAAEGPTGISM
jgi:hypothetical protein